MVHVIYFRMREMMPSKCFCACRWSQGDLLRYGSHIADFFCKKNPACGDDDVTEFRKILQKNTKQRRKGCIYIALHFVLSYY